MGYRAFPLPEVTAKSWKLEDRISPNIGVLSSLIKCNVAMLATNPMPGNPSINMGSLRSGFSVKYTVQVIAFSFLVGLLWCVMSSCMEMGSSVVIKSSVKRKGRGVR